MVRSRRPPGQGWVYDPARAFRQSNATVTPDVQREVQRRGHGLIDSALKPRHIQPPPKTPELNCLVDICSQWRGPFFYFGPKYCSPGSRVLSPSFESRFAKLQCAGDRQFNLAHFRHTGQCWESAQHLSLEECFTRIGAGGIFTP
jgi:hypothetical protein